MSDTDLALLSTVSGLVGALLGAVLGAVFTYRLTRRLEHERVREATSRLMVLILSEVDGHLNVTAHEVDRLLPYWMWRGWEDNRWVAEGVRGGPPVALSTSSFDTHHASLLHADDLLQITFHYDNVRHLQSHAAALGAKGPGEAVAYVRSCVRTMQSALGTMDVLLRRDRLRALLSAYDVSVEDNYRSLVDWYESRVGLAELDVERLQELEDGGPSASPPRLGDSWRDLLRATRAVRTGG